MKQKFNVYVKSSIVEIATFFMSIKQKNIFQFFKIYITLNIYIIYIFFISFSVQYINNAAYTYITCSNIMKLNLRQIDHKFYCLCLHIQISSCDQIREKRPETGIAAFLFLVLVQWFTFTLDL